MTLKEVSYKISMSIGLKIATQDYYNGRETIVYRAHTDSMKFALLIFMQKILYS